LPSRYATTQDRDWYIEEARIRGGYNNTSVDFGVKAYIVDESPQRERLLSTLIYSGVFNSKTGLNNTNQFSVADDITRAVDPAQGSIQRLYAEDTNLIIFQELKVSRALINKDAVYSAEGQPMTTSGTQVIGQIQSYAGNYGIGSHPESFAVYGYRKYFTDRNQNVVLRLSQDGITEISAYGMIDYFRDNLSSVARKVGVSVSALKKANRLKSTKLKKGQVLVYYKVVSTKSRYSKSSSKRTKYSSRKKYSKKKKKKASKKKSKSKKRNKRR
jgi:hypothetical protein